MVSTKFGPSYRVRVDGTPTAGLTPRSDPVSALPPTGARPQPGLLNHAPSAASTLAEPRDTLVLQEGLRLIKDQQQTILELSGRLGFLQAQLQQRDEALRMAPSPSIDAPAAVRGWPDGLAAEVLELVRQAQEQVTAKAEAAAMWQARAELLAAELASAREQLRVLQPPRDG
jgi:hypothetical protein